ncbi:hypothetical protein SARC_03578 [Sphaeroforma arctica JP610]|uniref:Histone H4 n=1 Tax=Sphaeroforma arctica JP610 TaxID=667725 RepID=A0A0L0G7J0_9EUKA|nr:hypothetical protein SARC_03578 [Sphaeroforma arctica JP610]KNC84188.1 hypothetical protein SARC_03578 [Sphaeroforma arctica JP610]|eukprot:XP_014158090.1 hypothetical protein SARC_03578 [Sphaeroforma arctica JP610]
MRTGSRARPESRPGTKPTSGLRKEKICYRRHVDKVRGLITMRGITKPDIRRLARRGGVKRISGLIYDEMRQQLKLYLANLVRLALTYCQHRRQKTVTAMDVVYAVRLFGERLYGFGS